MNNTLQPNPVPDQSDKSIHDLFGTVATAVLTSNAVRFGIGLITSAVVVAVVVGRKKT